MQDHMMQEESRQGNAGDLRRSLLCQYSSCFVRIMITICLQLLRLMAAIGSSSLAHGVDLSFRPLLDLETKTLMQLEAQHCLSCMNCAFVAPVVQDKSSKGNIKGRLRRI